MKELENFFKEVRNCTTMLIKEVGAKLECSFIKRGKVRSIVMVSDEVLADALRELAVHGILEGEKYHAFSHSFDWFALHIKAKKLYLDLRFSLQGAQTSIQAPAKKEIAA